MTCLAGGGRSPPLGDGAARGRRRAGPTPIEPLRCPTRRDDACERTYAFGPASGSPVWERRTDCSGGGGRTPVVADGGVWIRDGSGGAAGIERHWLVAGWGQAEPLAGGTDTVEPGRREDR